MTDAQIRTWQQTLEGRFYEGHVTDLDINALLEELVELRGRVARLDGGQTQNDPRVRIEREILFGQR